MIDIKKYTVEKINKNAKNTMVEFLDIEITEIGADFICGKMPVSNKTIQPAGILHGGASVVLAETLGSIAGNCCIDTEKFYCVGLEINANHIRPVPLGNMVFARANAIHLGKKTQIWEIKITNAEDKLVCISRLTLSVVSK
ncbi:MAG: hotdog fold thioesterase [Candidatus Sericytochromatia bacterium]